MLRAGQDGINFIFLKLIMTIQVEDTCLIALATAYNARESEGGTTKQELLHFVEEVSWVYIATHKEIFPLFIFHI